MLSAVNEEKNFRITDIKQPTLFFSNRLENLFHALKEQIIQNKKDPFSRTLLIVPSRALEQWVRLQIAEESGIAAGIETFFLSEAIDHLAEILFEPITSLSTLELIFRVESELSAVVEETASIWEPVQRYIGGREGRLLSLAKHLAHLFARYRVYQWERGSGTWQEALWERIFPKGSTLLELLPTIKEKRGKSPDLSVHLFGFSHLAPLFFSFFGRVGRRVPTYLYQLSPCREFWSDLPEEALLLSRLGRVGAQMARLVEESQLTPVELYHPPEASTALGEIQRQLLLLEEGEIQGDASIEIHAAPTPNREIEVLHAQLKEQIAAGDLEPRDVVVMAPDITRYTPYIRAHFSHYQIADLPMHLNSSLLEGLFAILELDHNRWSAPALLALFDNPYFREKRRWNEEDLIQIREWIQETGIRWGLDGNDRDRLLKQDHCRQGMGAEGATWRAGLGHLLEELALSDEQARIDFVQAELLGDLLTSLEALAKDVAGLYTKKTLKTWVAFLKEVCGRYFFGREEMARLFSDFEKIGRLASLYPERLYSFKMIEMLLKETIGQELTTVNGNQVQAIRFCSLLPMRAIPAKVICLIGMDEGAFPRKERLKGLDRFSRRDYFPSSLDFDRYLFLETLLSARERLWISYVHTEGPSLLIDECFPNVSHQLHSSRHYTLKETKRINSPSFFAPNPQPLSLPEGNLTLTLTDLLRAIRSPIGHYLRHNWELSIWDAAPLQEEESFTLTPLRRAILRRNTTFEAALRQAHKEGDFPIGTFGKLAERQLEAEIVPLEEALEERSFTLSFPFSEKLTITLSGTLSNLYGEGLLLSEKKSVKGFVRAWPCLLLLHYLDPTKETLYFGSDERVVPLPLHPSEEALRTLLEYYFLASHTPSLLYPEWVAGIARKKLGNTPLYDRALEWVLKTYPLPTPDEIFAQWTPWTQKLYGEALDVHF